MKWKDIPDSYMFTVEYACVLSEALFRTMLPIQLSSYEVFHCNSKLDACRNVVISINLVIFGMTYYFGISLLPLLLPVIGPWKHHMPLTYTNVAQRIYELISTTLAKRRKQNITCHLLGWTIVCQSNLKVSILLYYE